MSAIKYRREKKYNNWWQIFLFKFIYWNVRKQKFWRENERKKNLFKIKWNKNNKGIEISHINLKWIGVWIFYENHFLALKYDHFFPLPNDVMCRKFEDCITQHDPLLQIWWLSHWFRWKSNPMFAKTNQSKPFSIMWKVFLG